MKLTKREENWIIIQTIFFASLTLILLIYIFSSLVPSIIIILNDKKELLELQKNIERINTKWLNFDEFKELASSNATNKVMNEILVNMTDEFYSGNLINNTEFSYENFLKNKEDLLNSPENLKKVEDKNNQIISVLPTYSEEWISLWNEILTDYKFINYIESIIESFNLTTTSSIWINRLVLVEDYAISNKAWEWLDSNIYYIPLNLDIKWTKSWIINFLYFIENVWNIKLEWDNIIVNDNYSFLSKNWVKKILEWDKNSSTYNIFKNQMIDIERISMSEYLDQSYKLRWDSDFINFINETQWNDKFEINVNLKFYIKWLPVYKVNEFITWILDKYNKTVWLLNTKLQSTDIKWVERVRLTQNNDLLKQLSTEVTELRKESSKNENLDQLYKRILTIDDIINPIFKSLQK